MPLSVSTRWMYVTLLNRPLPAPAFLLSSSQGMSPPFGAEVFSICVPITLLPSSSASQVGIRRLKHPFEPVGIVRLGLAHVDLCSLCHRLEEHDMPLRGHQLDGNGVDLFGCVLMEGICSDQ